MIDPQKAALNRSLIHLEVDLANRALVPLGFFESKLLFEDLFSLCGRNCPLILTRSVIRSSQPGC